MRVPQELYDYILSLTDFVTAVKAKNKYAIAHFYDKEVHSWDWATMNGQLEVVQWLFENYKEGCTKYVMDSAAGNGHLEIVKWLHENSTEGCTTSAMNWAARSGHLDVVIWLHENRTEGCTTDAMDNAAYKGHLDVLRWLHENRTEGCTFGALPSAEMWDRGEVRKFLWDYWNLLNKSLKHLFVGQ